MKKLIKNSGRDTKHSIIWNEIGRFTFIKGVKWSAVKRVLREYNVYHHFDAQTYANEGGIIASVLADLVVSRKISLAQLKKKLTK